MNTQQIKAIGFFLAWYESDLTYIANFNRFKKGQLTIADYSQRGKHTFYSFLSEFRVTRNYKQGETLRLLNTTVKWLSSPMVNDVDSFAVELKRKGLTHGKVMTSLASKILFLNNPQQILPLDNRVRESVNQDSNLYKDYLPLVKDIQKNRKILLKECLSFVEHHAVQIEKSFKTELQDLKAIRCNRLLDKLLWSINGQIE